MTGEVADVCLVLEGTYPYVFGGVSSWVHELLKAHSELRFEIVALMPPGHDSPYRFELPDNVTRVTDVALQRLPRGRWRSSAPKEFFSALEGHLSRIQTEGRLADLAELSRLFGTMGARADQRVLLDSRPAWEMLLSMYRSRHAGTSFIDFFWSWRSMLSGLFSVLLAPIPRARVYHAVSTGYAGLLAARASVETGRPALLTEHGIYTNERRIELAMSDWLYERPSDSLAVETSRRDLKDLWVDTFTNYSRICYEACSRIITLYQANQQFQLADGADPGKLTVIPNGIDLESFASIRREGSGRPTVALIGRVVPIKDVKTYIRACALLRETVPDVKAYVLGPTEEDEEYYEECREMVRHLGLDDGIEFTGRVKLDEYLGRVDVIALTSISEAQPLVILEAGAAGIPTVATDVGACREMILGRDEEAPHLGPGGAVTPLASPAATARELARLLADPAWRHRCGEAIRQRVRQSYNKTDLDLAYRELYHRAIETEDRPDGAGDLARAS